MWPKRTQNCVYGDVMFMSTILLRHPSPIYRVLQINLDTSDIPMQHLCISASKYGGLYWTFHDTRNTQFLSLFFRHTSAKMKNDRQVVVYTLGIIKTCQTL